MSKFKIIGNPTPVFGKVMKELNKPSIGFIIFETTVKSKNRLFDFGGYFFVGLCSVNKFIDFPISFSDWPNFEFRHQ